jgi:hypothetical protein
MAERAKREAEQLKVKLEDEISAETKNYMSARLELSKRRKVTRIAAGAKASRSLCFLGNAPEWRCRRF